MDVSNLYIKFLYYFNVEKDYYECHEVMEELWLEEGRNPFYQGLLQVAVALYHFQNGNISGAVKLMSAALEKLDDCPDEWMGIDMGSLKKEAADYLTRLQNYDQNPFDFFPLSITILDSSLNEKLQKILIHGDDGEHT